MSEHHTYNGTIYAENNIKGVVTIAIEESDGCYASIHAEKQDIKSIIEMLSKASEEMEI